MSNNIISLPVDTLPSKGYGYNFKAVSIPRMVFSEILNYQADMEQCKNDAAEFITLLKDVVMTIPNGGSILLYDAIPIIAVRIYNSTAETLTDFIKIKYECPIHHKKESLEVRLKNFRFNDMNPLLKKIKAVRIGGKSYDFVLPTVSNFIEITETYRLKAPVNNALKYFYLLSMFKAAYDPKTQLEILGVLKTATSKDIVVLNSLYEMITGAFTGFMVTCNNGSEPVAVRLDSISPVTDIFQNILESEVIDEAAFDLRKDN